MQDEQTIEIEQVGNTTVVRVLPTSITPEVGERLLGYNGFTKNKMLILDLSNLLFLGSAGLSILVVYHKRAKECGGRLAIAGLDAECRKVVEVSGMTRTLDLHRDVASALEALGQKAAVTA